MSTATFPADTVHPTAAAPRPLRWLDPAFAVALVAALAMVVLTAWPVAAQAADRDASTEIRSVGDFDAVQTQGPTVQLRQGATTAVTVAGTARQLAQLETVVETTRLGRTLVLRWKRSFWPGGWSSGGEATVSVVAPRITGLQVSGSGDIQAEGLTPPSLLVRVEGSGDVRLSALATETLSLAVAGSGDITATGRATQLSASVAGSGDIRAEGLAADAVEVNIAGSGDVRVQADKTLSVRIAGAGDVVYGGNPTVRQSIVGSGSVTRR